MSMCSALLAKPFPRYSLHNMPQTSFTCRDKILGGYYADSETQCQMFHVCVKVAGVGVSYHSNQIKKPKWSRSEWNFVSNLRSKIFDSSAPMVQLLIKKPKLAPIGEMSTAIRLLYFMAAITLICTELVLDSRVRKLQPETTKTHSICNVPNQVRNACISGKFNYFERIFQTICVVSSPQQFLAYIRTDITANQQHNLLHSHRGMITPNWIQLAFIKAPQPQQQLKARQLSHSLNLLT